MRLQWTEDFSTGIADIDVQHQELFEKVNKFLEACDHGHCREEVDPLLHFLETYTRAHLAAEEKLQLQYAYPHYPTHKAAHEEFLRAFSQLKTKYDKEGPNNYLALLTYDLMVNWFINHMASEDKTFCHFLKEKNLA